MSIIYNSKSFEFGQLIGEIFEKLCYNITQS